MIRWLADVAESLQTGMSRDALRLGDVLAQNVDVLCDPDDLGKVAFPAVASYECTRKASVAAIEVARRGFCSEVLHEVESEWRKDVFMRYRMTAEQADAWAAMRAKTSTYPKVQGVAS